MLGEGRSLLIERAFHLRSIVKIEQVRTALKSTNGSVFRPTVVGGML